MQNNHMVVALHDPFRRMGAWRNSTETQQLDTPQDLNQRSKMEGAKDGALERLICRTIQEEMS